MIDCPIISVEESFNYLVSDMPCTNRITDRGEPDQGINYESFHVSSTLLINHVAFSSVRNHRK